MPPLHPLIIHFPIALFVIAVLFDGITAFTQKDSLLSATKLLYIFGYLGTLAALITGDMLKHQRAAVLPHTLLTLHEWLAIAFAIWFTVLLAVRLRRYWEPSKPFAAMALFGVLLLIAVGHTGGSMAWPTFKSSVAVSGVGTTGTPSTGSGATTKTNGKPGQALGDSGSGSSNNSAGNGNTNSSGNSSGGAAKGKSSTSGQSTSSAKAADPPSQSKSASGSSSTASSSTAGSSTKSSSSSSSSTALIQVGQQYFVEDCQSCHSLGVAEQYFGHLSKSDWTRVVQTMQSYAGGAIPDNQAQAIIAYVSSQP